MKILSQSLHLKSLPLKFGNLLVARFKLVIVFLIYLIRNEEKKNAF